MSAKAKSFKNPKASKTIRNVLVQPFKTKWPLVDENDAKRVTKFLEEVPRDHVVVGTNAALELLHTAKACALFLTSDFHPHILGKQIIRMARRNLPTVKILAIPGLKWDDNLQKMIAIRSGGQRADSLLQAMEEMIKANDFEDDLCASTVSIKKEKLRKRKVATKMGPEEISGLYLTSSESNQRAFIPRISSYATKSKVGDDKADWGEFISFNKSTTESMEFESDEEELEQKVESKLNISGKLNAKSNESLRKQNGPYIGLTVNRIQGNPNRRKNPKMKKIK
uniref:(northern house mosquito) hypothetical protein n=2 Tax=Culex pipiens TaxID=7175 RepID=A0A8D8AFI6_CULPI